MGIARINNKYFSLITTALLLSFSVVLLLIPQKASGEVNSAGFKEDKLVGTINPIPVADVRTGNMTISGKPVRFPPPIDNYWNNEKPMVTAVVKYKAPPRRYYNDNNTYVNNGGGRKYVRRNGGSGGARGGYYGGGNFNVGSVGGQAEIDSRRNGGLTNFKAGSDYLGVPYYAAHSDTASGRRIKNLKQGSSVTIGGQKYKVSGIQKRHSGDYINQLPKGSAYLQTCNGTQSGGRRGVNVYVLKKE